MYIQRRSIYLQAKAHTEPEAQLLQSLGFDYNETYNTYSRLYDETVTATLLALPDVQADADLQYSLVRADWSNTLPMEIGSKRSAYEHQKIANRLLRERDYMLLAWEMGAGKTKPVVDVASLMMQEDDADMCIVFTPSTVMGVWTYDAVPKDSDLPATMITGDAHERAFKLDSAYADGYNFIVLNYEAVLMAPVIRRLQSMITNKTIVVFDESHYVKNPAAKRTQLLYALVRSCKPQKIWMLTGTPISQSPEDIYGQAAILDDKIFGTIKQLKIFQYTYVEYSPHNKHVVLRYKNMKSFATRLTKFVYVVKKDEVLDLPEQTQQEIVLDMTPALAKIYRDFVNSKGVLKDTQGDVLLEAELPITRVMKCRQICNNWYYYNTDVIDPETEELSTNREERVIIPGLVSPKLEWIKEFAEVGDPFILWYSFVADKHQIIPFLQESRISFSLLDRSLAIDKRQDVINEFMSGKTQVFLSQPSVGGTGINLQRAKAMVYYNNQDSSKYREQSAERVRRPGLRHCVTVYDLMYRHTVEVTMLQRLMMKKAMSDAILSCNDDEIARLMTGAE